MLCQAGSWTSASRDLQCSYPEAGKVLTNEMNVRDDDAKDYLMAIVCCPPTFSGNFAASQCVKQETEVLVDEAVSRLNLVGLGPCLHNLPLSLVASSRPLSTKVASNLVSHKNSFVCYVRP